MGYPRMASMPRWIEQDPFFKRLAERLEAFRPRRIELSGFRPAAVLVLLWPQQGGPHILFIRRSDTVRYHKGEISFPGGSRDPRDVDLSRTALRETQEELGIPPESVSLLGRLDDGFSFSRFAIAPYVGATPSPPLLSPNKEVAEVIPLPLARLLSPDHFSVSRRSLNGDDVPVYTYEVDRRIIWGATARIVRGFLSLLDQELMRSMDPNGLRDKFDPSATG